MDDPSIGFFLLCNLYFMFMVVHLSIGVQWNLVALWTPLEEYLVYTYKRKDNDSMICLVV
jgi:hypothetical protein